MPPRTLSPHKSIPLHRVSLLECHLKPGDPVRVPAYIGVPVRVPPYTGCPCQSATINQMSPSECLFISGVHVRVSPYTRCPCQSGTLNQMSPSSAPVRVSLYITRPLHHVPLSECLLTLGVAIRVLLLHQFKKIWHPPPICNLSKQVTHGRACNNKNTKIPCTLTVPVSLKTKISHCLTIQKKTGFSCTTFANI